MKKVPFFFVFFASISGCINDSSLLLTAKICLMESINFITFSNARISYEESIFFFFFFFFFFASISGCIMLSSIDY